MTQQADMRHQMANAAGFIAALDQSGGSTPKALGLYGVDANDYGSEEEMFAEIQNMRERIILAPDFVREKVIGAILFERTLSEKIDGAPVSEYLWNSKGIVPFLKIDKGLEDTENGVQLMKPMPGLDEVLKNAASMGVFGTKERSVIHDANPTGIKTNVAQQFELAKQVCAAGLVPIVEPEVSINSSTKAEAEGMMRDEIMGQLDTLSSDETVMLKLTIPSQVNFYDGLADHPRVLRVVALSGGYSTDEACKRLSQNGKMIASFSRALTEGLQKQMSEAEFAAAIGANINQIYAASA
ncbi:MAG: fructose bisphosphate aldolase [Pseudomonadota bacterium]